MDTLQAAVVKVKLKYFSEEIELRNRVAKSYTAGLSGVVNTPVVPPGNKSVWAQYTIRDRKRDEIRETLAGMGIPTAIHYPMPLPRQEAFSYLNGPADYQVSDELAETVMSLPMHSFLEDKEIEQICNAVKGALK